MKDNMDQIKIDPKVQKAADESLESYKEKMTQYAKQTSDVQKGLIAFNLLSVLLQNPKAYNITVEDLDKQREELIDEAIKYADDFVNKVDINLTSNIMNSLG